MNSTYTLCPVGMKSMDLCILQPSNFCSFFLSLFFPPGMYFVRKTLTKLMSLLSLILIKYMAFLSFWNKKLLNGLPLHTLWQFRNFLLEKKKITQKENRSALVMTKETKKVGTPST